MGTKRVRARIDIGIMWCLSVMKQTNYCCNSSNTQITTFDRVERRATVRLELCPKKIRYLERFLIICRIWVSIRRIDAMTKVLIKSEWWNFSVHYINLNDVQFYPLYRMAWNGTRHITSLYTIQRLSLNWYLSLTLYYVGLFLFLHQHFGKLSLF